MNAPWDAAQDALALGGDGLPWVRAAPGAPYLETDDGAPWTPIGQNDAVTWPDLRDLFRRRDVAAVDRHLAWLASQGVTCLRLMMEYAQGEHRYLERPVGRFAPNMVRLWDDLLGLCARHGLRVQLTPFDTFWMWRRWRHHPYSRAQGGPCARRSEWLMDDGFLAAARARLSFATARWGAGGVIWSWDLWNEIHPCHMGGESWRVPGVIADLSAHLRAEEMRLHGRAHLQTASLFAPSLHDHPEMADPIFRHPLLDVATTHLYGAGPLDHPRNSVDVAVRAGEMMREAVGHAGLRPVLDTEHGPVHVFSNRRRTLPEAFDDECFRHVQWAHLASGGVGGGLRWPYRNPHVLTHGMRRAQRSLAGFLPLIDWPRFRRRNLSHEAEASEPAFARFACGDDAQAVAWLLRTDTLVNRGRLLSRRARPLPATLRLPGLRDGPYEVVAWDTEGGHERGRQHADSAGGVLAVEVPPTPRDVALAIRPA